MYSGSDSADSLKNQKWPSINPMYPNTSNDQIDWAALAHQWIIMKEAGPPVPDLAPPSPPPPPRIHDITKEDLSEGGEAPMEVENEKEENAHTQWTNDVSQNEGSWNWNQQQWAYSWTAPVPTNIPSKAPLLPTPGYSQYSSVPPDTSTNFQYNNKTNTTSEYSSGYWTSSSSKSKPHNKRYSKVNVAPKQPPPSAPATIADPINLDANRRKQLPAWIRDGLEKMERDKLKQLEKEKEKHENKKEETKPKFNQREALEIIKSTVKERERSKFDSDGDDSSDDAKTSFKKQTVPEPVMISHEELMLRIRRTMTEILLQVTNQEILAVCKEEFQRRLRKRKASDHRVSAPSGNQLSSKLGVGIYGESESSSGESDSDSDQESVDSEAELKAVIRRRKADFVKTEREIEERLAAAESAMNDGLLVGTPATNHSQVDSKHQDNRVKLGNVGYATSPKYNSIKHKVEKISSSDSSDRDSDSSDKRYDKGHNRKLSTSESTILNQRNLRDHLKRNEKSETPEKNLKHKTRHSRRSRSKSDSPRRNRSRSKDKYQDYKSYRQYSKRSRSRSSSRSYLSTESNSRRSDSYSVSTWTRKSRSRSRSRHRKSNSPDYSSHQYRVSRSRRKSRSFSPENRYRRSRSRSSSRGKRSQRH